MTRTANNAGKSPFLYANHFCNNNCFFCFEKNGPPPPKTFSRLKEEMALIRKNFDFINIMGQEPTLRKDLIGIIDHARALGFKQIGITTNGRMFFYPDFTRRVLQSGLNQIVITVAGCDPKVHDAHTSVKNSFEQTLGGIRNILAAKDRINPRLSLLINIMVSQKNYRRLVKIVDFYARLGIKEINIGHIMPLNNNIRTKEVIAPMGKVAPALVKIQNKYGRQIKFLFVEYPACVFPRAYRHLAFPCLEGNPRKIRIKICSSCDFREKCGGIPRDYLDLYGEKEFKS